MQKNIFKALGIFTFALAVMSVAGAASAPSSYGHNSIHGHNHYWKSFNDSNVKNCNDGSCKYGNVDSSNSLNDNSQDCNNGYCCDNDNDGTSNNLNDNSQNCNNGYCSNYGNNDSSNSINDNSQNYNNGNDGSSNSLNDSSNNNGNGGSTDNGNAGSTVSITNSDYEIVHPHEGNTYWTGADGHEISLIHNKNAVNPTFDQLLTFIKNDKTDERQYIPGQYTCGDFAETVQNNAEKAGIIAGWVSIEGIDHACNAFQTTDKGLVFIDCTGSPSGGRQSDTIVDLQVGQDYRPVSIYNQNEIFDSMGIVSSYEVYW